VTALEKRPPTTAVSGRVLRAGDVLSLTVQPRAVTVCLVLAALTVVIGLVTLATGEVRIPVSEVVATLQGNGTGRSTFVVNVLRLPRLLTAVCAGAALAIAGSIFQQLTVNPLASPDIVGFTTGAATGAVVTLLVYPDSPLGIAGGALLGGFVTTALVYLLMLGRPVQGFRIILVGIGISALLTSVNDYLLTRAGLHEAMDATRWLVGSLNARTWDQLRPLALAMAVLVPLALALGRRLTMLQMGDEAARARGVPVGRTRLVLVLVAVALTAAAVATAGPIGFIALAAPQLARRVTRAPGSGLVAAALMGAFLLVLSDLAAQRLFSANPIPVGYATTTLGGAYLAWLLVKEWRGGRM
jgi:iron complex transport system permease protein